MLLGNKLAPRRGVEPLYSARQADIIDRYMNEAKLGGSGRIRTYNVSYVADLQSVAFNQFSTHFHLFVTHSPLCFLTPSRGERRMCVLKHSKLISLTVRKECFNTLGFFISQKRLHRLGRPFTTVYRVLRGPRFLYHVAILAGTWPTFLLVYSSMILCHTFHLILDQLFKLFLSKSVCH